MISRIGVILLNWNNWRDTKECLASLRAMRDEDAALDLVVVDNGSTDGSVAELRRETGIAFLELPTNRGFAAGCNTGIRHALGAACDYILLLNTDTALPDSFLAPMLQLCRIDARTGVVCPKIRYQDDPWRLWYAGGRFRWPRLVGEMVGLGEVDRGQYDQAGITDFAVGCCMLITREVLERIGYLDERFFFYQEDVDFSYRAAQAGFGVWYQPASIIYHRVSRSTQGDTPRRTFLCAESRVVFFAKHIPRIRLPLVAALEVVRLVRTCLRYARQGHPELAASYVKGIISGLRKAHRQPAYPAGSSRVAREAG